MDDRCQGRPSPGSRRIPAKIPFGEMHFHPNCFISVCHQVVDAVSTQRFARALHAQTGYLAKTQNTLHMTLKNQIHIPIGDQDQNEYVRDLRHNLNMLLSMALASNAIDLDQQETEALRGVSDFMLTLHYLETLGREAEA